MLPSAAPSSAPADRPACRTSLSRSRLPTVVGIVLLLTVSAGAGLFVSSHSTSAPAKPFAHVVAPVGPLAAARESLASGHGPVPGTRWDCAGTNGAMVRCSVPPATARPQTSGASGWLPGGAVPGGAIQGSLLVYDARDAYVLLMAITPSSNLSWQYGSVPIYYEFSNGHWSQPDVVAGPSFCVNAALAYDSTDHKVVYWGGQYCSSAGDTWTYSAGNWTNVTAGSAPPATPGFSLSDDPSISGLLLFTGTSTWSFVAGNWSQPAGIPTEPTAESGGAMSYDSADHGVLLVEGSTATSFWPSYSTWFFNGTWHSEPTVPSPYAGKKLLDSVPAMADDPTDGYVVLVPAWNNTNSTGVWFQYANGTWANGSGRAGLLEGRQPALAFDGAVSRQVLLEGQPTGPAATWTYAGGSWANLSANASGPAARADIAMAYDAADGYVVAFGGCECAPNLAVSGVQSDTWTYSAGNWTRLTTNASPPARSLAGLVYDASDGYVLLFGGQAASGVLNDTWEFTAGGWTRVTPLVAPPWYQGETMAYDAADNYVVLLTGWIPASTWTYHAGAWTNRTALGDRSIDGAPANPIVYDSANQEVLLFGTAAPHLESSTWTFRGGNWTNDTGSAGPTPPARSDASVADFPPGGFVVLYGGSQAFDGLASPRSDTWAFNTTWTQLVPAISPGNRSDMFGAYDPHDRTDVFFGGWYGQFYPAPAACSLDGPCGDTWLWSGGSPSVPLIQSFSATPATVDLGSTTQLTVAALGGTAPFTYSYSGLPTGCASANISTLGCTPTAVATFLVTVDLTDSLGHRASARTLVTVNPAVSVTAFFAAPSPTSVAERTLLSVQTTQGTEPISYAYSGLPPGCTSQDVPTLPCIPTGSGNFTVRVGVSDAGGGSAGASLNLSVVASGSAGSLRITGFWFAPSTVVLGNSSTISVNATSASGPLTYAFGNLPPGCTNANASSLTCLPTSAGTYGITITVRDSIGDVASVFGNLTVDPVGGDAGLSIVGFGASPGLVYVGTTVVVSVVASGGTGALTYRYPSLPTGCVSANTSALPCAPSASGTYPLYVVVTDSAGHARGAVGALVVQPAAAVAPAVSAFFASPANVTLGNSTTLVAEARGTLPLVYYYTGLPAGCASVDAGVLNCTSAEAGTFHVTVTVTDQEGRHAQANTSFSVSQPTSHPKPPANPVTSAASGGEPVLLWAVIGALVGALLSLATLEYLLARRRDREEGEAIVRALSRPDGEEPPSGPEP